eukprot:Tbor_TRINITY_DN4190_c0_g1::TRINITY_DN4190_c0_g1_i1::g.26526::m.26526/K20347/TMED2, EMP24; p24 family protein beta-1
MMEKIKNVWLSMLATYIVLASISMSATLADCSTALTVQVPAGKDECFFETVLLAGTKIYFHYMVTHGGELDIDVNVHGPDDILIWETEASSESRILFKSAEPGLHKFCFSNKMSTLTSKSVAFDVQVGDTTAEALKKDPMERSVMNIHQGLYEIKNEQAYLRDREVEHRSTAESTHSYILMWSFLEMGLILVMAIAHVMYLRRLFQSRRIV